MPHSPEKARRDQITESLWNAHGVLFLRVMSSLVRRYGRWNFFVRALCCEEFMPLLNRQSLGERGKDIIVEFWTQEFLARKYNCNY